MRRLAIVALTALLPGCRDHQCDVVLRDPKVTILRVGEGRRGGELLKRSVKFVADDHVGVTAAELLWKLNEDAVPRRARQDAVFFEGLARVGSHANRPRYSVLLES